MSRKRPAGPPLLIRIAPAARGAMQARYSAVILLAAIRLPVTAGADPGRMRGITRGLTAVQPLPPWTDAGFGLAPWAGLAEPARRNGTSPRAWAGQDISMSSRVWETTRRNPCVTRTGSSRFSSASSIPVGPRKACFFPGKSVTRYGVLAPNTRTSPRPHRPTMSGSRGRRMIPNFELPAARAMVHAGPSGSRQAQGLHVRPAIARSHLIAIARSHLRPVALATPSERSYAG
jgi:hypothetical protein